MRVVGAVKWAGLNEPEQARANEGPLGFLSIRNISNVSKGRIFFVFFKNKKVPFLPLKMAQIFLK